MWTSLQDVLQQRTTLRSGLCIERKLQLEKRKKLSQSLTLKCVMFCNRGKKNFKKKTELTTNKQQQKNSSQHRREEITDDIDWRAIK